MPASSCGRSPLLGRSTRGWSTVDHLLLVDRKLLLAQNSFGSVDTSDIVALIPSCCGGSPFLPDEDCNPLRCCDRSPVLDQLADAGQEAGYTGLPMVTLGLPMVHSGPAGRTGHNSTIDDPHKQFLGSPSLSTH